MGFVVGALPILYLIVCWYQNWRTQDPNSRALDQVPQTPEYLGCTRTQIILDSSHHNNNHAPSVSLYPESINRDTTNTHWPLDIIIIHSLAILWQKKYYHLVAQHHLPTWKVPNIWEGNHNLRMKIQTFIFLFYILNCKIYHTVNRLRSFLSSCHPVIWSSCNHVIQLSCHPVI